MNTMFRPALKLLMVAVSTFSWPAHQAFAAEPNWPSSPYNFIVIDQDVRDTLVEFGRNTDIPVNISTSVKGRVKGKLPSLPPKEFLSRLTGDYGLVWYYDGSLMHISSVKENATEILRPVPGTLAEAEEKLRKSNLLDDRFTFKPSADGSTVVVSGPPAYREAVKGIMLSVRQETVRVFRGAPAS